MGDWVIRHVTKKVAGITPGPEGTTETYTKRVSLPAEVFGKAAATTPTIVTLDNLTLYAFTLNADLMTFKFSLPGDYDSGPLRFNVIWTNDGGADDNGLNVRWQFDFQVSTEGGILSGSHTDSPKTAEDTYLGAQGNVEMRTPFIEIPAEDFVGQECVFIKLTAVTPVGAALTCNPRLVGICFAYTASRVVLT